VLEDEALNNKYINDTLKIFYMKNKCGYKDRQEIDNNISVKDPFDELSVEELKKLANDDWRKSQDSISKKSILELL